MVFAVRSCPKLSEAVRTVDELPNIKGSFFIADNVARNQAFGAINIASGVMSVSSFSHNVVVLPSYNVASATVQDVVTLDFGNNQPHNNVVPSKAVYAWIRTA